MLGGVLTAGGEGSRALGRGGHGPAVPQAHLSLSPDHRALRSDPALTPLPSSHGDLLPALAPGAACCQAASHTPAQPCGLQGPLLRL